MEDEEHPGQSEVKLEIDIAEDPMENWMAKQAWHAQGKRSTAQSARDPDIDELLMSGEDDTSDEEFLPPSGSSDKSSDESEPEDGDEDGQPPTSQEIPVGFPQVITAVDGTQWSKVPVAASSRTRVKNILKTPPTEVPYTHHAHDPYDSFKLFVSDKIVEDVVKYTNSYGRKVSGENWAPCDAVEIEALIGALLYLGVQKQNMLSTDNIWDRIDGVNLIRACMSRDRFRVLLACLRFDDKDTRSARRALDVFAPFREIWEEFNSNLSKYYIPGPLLTVDEQLVPFRGRCSFIQYHSSKPDRYGIKVFWIADAQNNYPLWGIPYLGRPLGQDWQVNLGRNLVLQLATPFFKTGRNVTCDNYFTDLVLAETLLKNGLTMVGTVRTNKRFLPVPFKSNKSLSLHESQFAYRQSTTMVSYQSKRNKNTVVLSTMHDEGIIDDSTRKQKPELVLFYNETKGSVDAMDKLAHTYTTKRKTKRWSMVMFANVLDLATIAARCVFRIKFPDHKLSSKDSRGTFIRQTSKKLMLAHLQRRVENVYLPRELCILIKNAIEDAAKQCDMAVSSTPCHAASTSGPPATEKARKRRRCTFCTWKQDRKTNQQCHKCLALICPEHVKKLCPSCCKE